MVPFGASATTDKNIETRTRNKVTRSPARSPLSISIRKLIQETTTNIAEGIIICRMWLNTFLSSLIKTPVAV